MSKDRKLILYIAASLDGYIAKPNDDLDFLSLVQMEGEDYGYADFIKDVDTVILGRKTYDWVLKNAGYFPHADKKTFVITRTHCEQTNLITFYTGNLKELVTELKGNPGKNIFCDGGSEIVNLLLKEKLIDEIILSIIPVLLGNGTRLFMDERPDQNLRLKSTKQYNSGLVQLHYCRKE